MKKLLKRNISYFFQFFLKKRFRTKIKQLKPNTTVWVIDIDNTIADSWRTFQSKWKSEKERLLNIPVLNGTAEYIFQHKKEDDLLVFLSARNYLYFNATFRWLQKNNFTHEKAALFLVAFPHEKLSYLYELQKIKQNFIYLDDLSYNHENGQVKFYTQEIEQVQKLGIDYIDYYKINQLNQKNDI